MAERAPIAVQVNGQTRHCPAPLAVPEALEQLGFDPRLVALEYNGEILPRERWSQTWLQAGDRLEVVTIVGGG
jgi:sulfur carrier protein